MNGPELATDFLMERFLQFVLEHPERFVRSEVPCAIQALWELALEDATALTSPLGVEPTAPVCLVSKPNLH